MARIQPPAADAPLELDEVDDPDRCRHDLLPITCDICRLLVNQVVKPSWPRLERAASIPDRRRSTGRGRGTRLPGLVNKPPSAPGTPSDSNW